MCTFPFIVCDMSVGVTHCNTWFACVYDAYIHVYTHIYIYMYIYVYMYICNTWFACVYDACAVCVAVYMCGVCCVVCGVWCVLCAVCCVVCAVWCVVCAVYVVYMCTVCVALCTCDVCVALHMCAVYAVIFVPCMLCMCVPCVLFTCAPCMLFTCVPCILFCSVLQCVDGVPCTNNIHVIQTTYMCTNNIHVTYCVCHVYCLTLYSYGYMSHVWHVFFLWHVTQQLYEAAWHAWSCLTCVCIWSCLTCVCIACIVLDGVALVSRIDNIIGLFRKRALQKRR